MSSSARERKPGSCQPGRNGSGVLPRTLAYLELVAPGIDDDDSIRSVVYKKLDHDFPWTTDGVSVEFWGLRRPDSGTRVRDRFRIRGPTLPLHRLAIPVRALIAWASHFVLTLARRRPGILAAPIPRSGVGAAAACALRRRPPPLVVRIKERPSSRALLVRGSRLRSHLLEAIERFVLRRADLVVPIGQYTRKRALEAGVPEERILVIPSATSWRDAPLEPIRNDERDDQLVVCAARLTKEKGIDVLLGAFARVHDSCPDARLRIAGGGLERPRLERLTERLELSDRVEFVGWLSGPEVWRLFSSAGIAVLPSLLEEGLGRMLIEAGLAGCALVASDLGGTGEIVQPGVTGILVPPGDERALADALLRCLTDHRAAAGFRAQAQGVARAYIESRDDALRSFNQRMEELRWQW
jgi:glycosyltransferase involved in cell wall biosynthesis